MTCPHQCRGLDNIQWLLTSLQIECKCVSVCIKEMRTMENVYIVFILGLDNYIW